MIGTTFGNYRVVDRIGEGGMGVVYRVEHMLIGKWAALKVLLPAYSQDRTLVLRFFNEAKATSAICHKSIVEVLDFGYGDDGSAYILMEYLDGEPLSHRLQPNATLAVKDAFRWIRQIAGALDAAHQVGIVHRDLKPENIFIVPDAEVVGGERIKLLDFGIAKLAGDRASSVKTRTGAVMGTPAYMSPEQCKGAGDIDSRSDLYSLGCILFEMLCGRPPFMANGGGEVMARHILVEPPPLSAIRPSIAPEIDRFVARSLNKDLDKRFQSARQIIADIDVLFEHLSTTGSHTTAARPRTHPIPPERSAAPMGVDTTLSAGAVSKTILRPTAGAWRLLVLSIAVGLTVVIAAVAVWLNPAARHGSRADADLFDAGPGDDAIEDESPTQQWIVIKSKPSRAAVFDEHKRRIIGYTPFEMRLPIGITTIVRVIRKKGYDEHKLTLPEDATDGQVIVKLKRSSKKSKKRKRKKRSPDPGDTLNGW